MSAIWDNGNKKEDLQKVNLAMHNGGVAMDGIGAGASLGGFLFGIISLGLFVIACLGMRMLWNQTCDSWWPTNGGWNVWYTAMVILLVLPFGITQAAWTVIGIIFFSWYTNKAYMTKTSWVDLINFDNYWSLIPKPADI